MKSRSLTRMPKPLMPEGVEHDAFLAMKLTRHQYAETFDAGRRRSRENWNFAEVLRSQNVMKS